MICRYAHGFDKFDLIIIIISYNMVWSSMVSMVQFVETICYETFGFELAGMATWLTSLGVCFHNF